MLALSQLQPRLAEPAVDTDNSNKVRRHLLVHVNFT